MTAESGADGPWAAGIAWGGCGGVVAAFAEGVADGVDGRHVEDVEAHGGDGGQEGLDVGEGALAGGIWRCGTGEELVPGGVAGTLAVDPEGKLLWVAGGEGQVRMLGGDVDGLGGQGEALDGGVGCGEVVEVCGGLSELMRGGAFGSLGGLFEEDGSGA